MLAKKLPLLLSLLLLVAACSEKEPVPVQAPTTLILVRHAEKADDGTNDPPLTGQGEARAEMLKNMFPAAGVEAVYSTPYKRNLATVKPLADTLGLEVVSYDPGQNLDVFLDEVLKKHAGQTVLICGHSNTVPVMLNVLTGENRYENLSDGDYDNLFFVTVSQAGDAVVMTLKMACL